MDWTRFSHGFRLDPIAKVLPEALVVLLHDFGDAAATLMPIGARWAAAVPTTAFVVLDHIDQSDLPSGGFPPHARLDAGVGGEVVVLDCAAPRLQSLLEGHLRSQGLGCGQLVLVGFGNGGTLALHMLLSQGLVCAGVLAFGARLARPLPRVLRIDRKVRLIECAEDRDIGQRSLANAVALLTARGIDTRGVLLVGSALSDEAVRHGGAYLVELVANAQRGARFHVDQER